MEPTIGQLSYSEKFGGFAMWPDQLHWSFQFIRLVSKATAGGGDFTEVYHATRDIAANDIDTWHEKCVELASNLEAKARESLAGGHRISARDRFLRASNYHRSAGFFWDPPHPWNTESAEARVRCFREAIQLMDNRVEPVEIPYEGTTLPGYLCWPTDDTPRPLSGALVFGGGDAITEEMYFNCGKALMDRGFAVLLVDGPGMGEALRRGIHARPDWEVPTTASYEFLAAQDGVDPDRIAIIGESLGGYYSARGATGEHRLGACVVWGGSYRTPSHWFDFDEDGNLPSNGRPARRIMALLGTTDIDEARDLFAQFTLEGRAQDITCPVLSLQGGNEGGFSPGEEVPDPTARLFAEIPHDNKTRVVFPAGTPGSSHCQHDSDIQAQEVMGDWLEEVFRR